MGAKLVHPFQKYKPANEVHAVHAGVRWRQSAPRRGLRLEKAVQFEVGEGGCSVRLGQDACSIRMGKTVPRTQWPLILLLLHRY